MTDLEGVLRQLHDSEINAGVKTFYDAGIKIWIGDIMNGHHSETMFSRENMGKAGALARRRGNAIISQGVSVVFKAEGGWNWQSQATLTLTGGGSHIHRQGLRARSVVATFRPASRPYRGAGRS
jgi:hypothetical protein